MNKFLNYTIDKLKNEYKNYPAVEGVFITNIIKSIQKKTPESILKEIDLFEFFDNYTILSKKTLPELTDFLSSSLINKKKAIDILIAIYILNGSKGKLKWEQLTKIPSLLVNTQDNYLKNDISFLLAQNAIKPTRQPEKLISKFIHGKRIMPPGSPFEGIYDIYKTPYIVEICDNMSPYSMVRHQAVKKAVQTAVTTAAENVIAYGIGERPIKMMYMTATDNLVEKFSNTRLEPLIDSCNFRDLIFAQNENAKSRKTGDKSQYKEFIGGTLALVSMQSAASIRFESIKLLIRDEIDGAPRMLTTGEGKVTSVSEGRLEGFGDRAKVFDISTPTITGDSLIDEQYARGDKRKYFVPCPLCGKMQFLSMGTEKSNYGLKGDYKAGELIQGYYLCFYCHDAVFDHHKINMLNNGKWIPTVTAIDRYFRSYHLPSFYSPPGMTSFTKIIKKYNEAILDGDSGMCSFMNLYLAKSFKQRGERPAFRSVIELRSTYTSGTVPEGIMYLTGAADVQQGIDKYKDWTDLEIQKEVKKLKSQAEIKKLASMPRIELEIMGHGSQFRTASIKYKIFYGRIDDDQSGSWKQLTNWIKKGNFKFKRKDGYEFNVKILLIDSGYGKYTDLVYNYCETLPSTYACKGAKTPKKDKLNLINIDEMNPGNITRFKLSKSGSFSFILINTNYYKRNIYRLLKNTFQQGERQPPNSHQTPSDYPDSYFAGLTAEEQKTDGSFHNIAQRANEPLDLLVYHKVGSDFWIDNLIVSERYRIDKLHKKKGRILKPEELRKLSNRSIITARLEAELRKKGW